MEGILYLEDGTLYKGKGFGAPATNVGELVFNTAMTGYQGMLTDPAAAGLIINMTYPLIGNYGVSDIDNQSERVHAFGLVTRDITFRPSNRCSVLSLSDWLREQGVPGVYNVDTRAIMKKIRSCGTQKCLISTEGISKEYAQELIEGTELRKDYFTGAGVELRVTRKGSSAEGVPGRGLKIAALDFGVKRGIVKALTDRGCDVVLCPYDTTADEIAAMGADAMLLTSGPGDPNECASGIRTAAALIGKLPVFGIDMGHMALALAAGGSLFRMKFGHHGGNHGVKDIETGRSVITSQGHGFAVDAESLAGTDMIVTHINLNDGTVEGIKHKTLPVFSVQFHPEGTPGPSDAGGIFDRFIDMAIAAKHGARDGGEEDA